VALDIPVVFFTFNRPNLSQQVFEKIKESRPRTLYFVNDGPRVGVQGDLEKVRKVRKLVDLVDWPCDVRLMLSEENKGVRRSFFEALDRVFEEVPAAIILEDDCLPSNSFFSFAEKALANFQDNPDIGSVAGTNFLGHYSPEPHSAFLGKHPHIWGWGTWSREWRAFRDSGYRERIGLLDQLRVLFGFNSIISAAFFANLLLLRSRLNTWDIDFALFERRTKKFAIYPPANLVSNVGLGAVEATHSARFGLIDSVPSFELMEIRMPSDPSFDEKFEVRAARKRATQIAALIARSIVSKVRTNSDVQKARGN
jgi:hypothetical protein